MVAAPGAASIANGAEDTKEMIGVRVHLISVSVAE